MFTNGGPIHIHYWINWLSRTEAEEQTSPEALAEAALSIPSNKLFCLGLTLVPPWTWHMASSAQQEQLQDFLHQRKLELSDSKDIKQNLNLDDYLEMCDISIIVLSNVRLN